MQIIKLALFLSTVFFTLIWAGCSKNQATPISSESKLIQEDSPQLDLSSLRSALLSSNEISLESHLIATQQLLPLLVKNAQFFEDFHQCAQNPVLYTKARAACLLSLSKVPLSQINKKQMESMKILMENFNPDGEPLLTLSQLMLINANPNLIHKISSDQWSKTLRHKESAIANLAIEILNSVPLQLLKSISTNQLVQTIYEHLDEGQLVPESLNINYKLLLKLNPDQVKVWQTTNCTNYGFFGANFSCWRINNVLEGEQKFVNEADIGSANYQFYTQNYLILD